MNFAWPAALFSMFYGFDFGSGLITWFAWRKCLRTVN